MVVVGSILAALAGAALFERLHVPAGALIGAMLAATALNLSGVATVPVPSWLRFTAYVTLGWLLGSQLTADTVGSLRQAVLPVAVIVVSLLLAGGLIAFGLRLMGLDPATAFLAASPGGISQMAAISVDIGANAPLVVAAHVLRVMSVVLTTPLVIRLLQ